MSDAPKSAMSTITYLDHAATTPLRPEVAAAMAAVYERTLGNPTGSHQPAQRARALLEESREAVAAFLGRDAGEIVFTSGGTESANLAVLGAAEFALYERGEAVVLVSAIEHPAVLESARAARRAGADARELPVDDNGVVAAWSRYVSVLISDSCSSLIAPRSAPNRVHAIHTVLAFANSFKPISDSSRP